MSNPITATTAPPPVQMLNVQIDGQWLQFPKGTRVIEACAQAGKYVPRYCYHPKLSSPGNCRMCLIEMGMPKMGADRKPELDADGKPVINWIPRPSDFLRPGCRRRHGGAHGFARRPAIAARA